MKVLVTGVKGQLGFDVVRELKSREYNNVIAIDKDELDITNKSAVKSYIEKTKPNVIIHCAAYTAVDAAEDNKDLCMKVNVDGTRYLVESAKSLNAKFVYISTDYVFDGEKDGIYHIDDPTAPTSVYGESKYLGELEALKHEKHYIIRISWVFGKNGNNFVKTMIRLGKERDSLEVVNDQFGSPTYTYDLSRLIIDMIESDKYGIYHATNEGICTWYEFAKEIFNQLNIDIDLNGITTDQYPTRAKRPHNSKLDKMSLDDNGFIRLTQWQDALSRYLKEIGEL